MRRHRLGSILLFALAVETAGCSLLGLGNFEVPPCEGQARCEPLNTHFGIGANECMRYGCVQGACVLAPRDNDGDGDPAIECGGTDCDDSHDTVRRSPMPRTEVCDGLDNDCNGAIDEGTSPAAAGVLSEAAGVTAGAFARDPSGGLGAAVVWSGSPTRGGFGSFPSTSATPTAVTAIGYRRLRTLTPIDETQLESGCPDTNNCNVSDVSMAAIPDSTSWVVTSVNTDGCSDGQLFIGLMDTEGPDALQIVLRGPDARSNLYRGVDVVNHCTGGSRPATSARGAGRPAVAAQIGDGAHVPQALAAWLGDSLTRPRCGNANAASVEAIGVWRESATTAGTQIETVLGTGNGVPQSLGTTTGGGRPAVLSWPGIDRGYFAAFGAANGGVTLRYVPRFGEPPPYDGTVRTTPPMDLGTLSTTIGSGAADHVVLALGSARAGGTDLGVAWESGCGSASSSIWFSGVRFTETGSPAFDITPPIQISTSDSSLAPTIAYVSSGMVREGFARNGQTAMADTDGGWFVLWLVEASGTSRIAGRRLLELDASPLDDHELDIPVASGVTPATLLGAIQAANGATARYAYFDRSGGTLRGSDLSCHP